MAITQIEGRDAGDVLLYALSTCPWCRKTKEFLNELGVAYRYVDVDQLTGEERTIIVAAVQRWNPSLSFPVLVINDTRAIIGLKQADIRDALQA